MPLYLATRTGEPPEGYRCLVIQAPEESQARHLALSHGVGGQPSWWFSPDGSDLNVEEVGESDDTGECVLTGDFWST